MATLDIANRYLAAAPVIVTSPTTRCGTTLVQRLLSASDNAFIYGEEIGNQARLLTNLFLSQIGHFETQGAAADQAFERALNGCLDDWRPALAPPSEVMLKAWSDTYYQLPMALADFGQSIGRPIWGFKWPGAAPEMARGLMALMPRSKIIYVTRDLVDALKSAKARRFVRTAADVDGFCAQWARHVTAFGLMEDNGRVVHLSYETLIADRAGQISLLEAFTGVSNIRAAAFDIKVNTYAGLEADGHSPDQYIEPEPLTDADRASVRDRAGPLMAQFYPQTPL